MHTTLDPKITKYINISKIIIIIIIIIFVKGKKGFVEVKGNQEFGQKLYWGS